MISQSSIVVVATLLLLPVLSYKNIATCIPGAAVKAGLPEEEKTLEGYASGLEKMSSVFGRAVRISEFDMPETCNEAAHAINLNAALVDGVSRAFGGKAHLEVAHKSEANAEKHYLFVFENKVFADYEYMSACIPGGVAGFNVLNMTKGYVGAYTVVLQAIAPDTLGDLMYLGKSTGTAGPCLVAQNAINGGNASAFATVKKGKFVEGLKQVGIFDALKKADFNDTYFYVFKNKNWNTTWGQFANPLVDTTYENWTLENPPKPAKKNGGGLGDLLGSILGGGQRRRKASSEKASDEKDSSKVGASKNKEDADKKKKNGGGLGDILGSVLGGGQRRRKASSEKASDEKESSKVDASENKEDADKKKKKGGIGGLVGGLFGGRRRKASDSRLLSEVMI